MMYNIDNNNILASTTYRYKCYCGNIYVTILYHDKDIKGVFSHLGKAGDCHKCVLEAITKLINIAISLSNDNCVDLIVKELDNLTCNNVVFHKSEKIASCVDAIIKAIKKFKNGAYTKINKNINNETNDTNNEVLK